MKDALAPPPTLRVVPLPRCAGEEPTALSILTRGAGEGDRPQDGGGGTAAQDEERSGSPAAADLLAAVSRETRDKLEIYVGELMRWQRVRNLVAKATLAEVWTRHVVDSLQVSNLGHDGIWADLGSGGGFPGLVVAILRPRSIVHLIESDSRKCAFLRHVARETGAPARVWDGRVEAVLPALDPPPAIVTSRALADLPTLFDLSHRVLMAGAIGLFPKGRFWEAELTRARESWKFAADIVPSRTDPEARILRISRVEGRRDRQAAQ